MLFRSGQPFVELGYFGLVRNATGEDWDNVALTLSTARPSLGGGAAEPSAWILDVARPQVITPVARGGRQGGQGQLQQQLSQNGFANNAALSNQKALVSNNLAVLNNGNVDANNFVSVGSSPLTLSGVIRDGASWATAAVDVGATSATFAIKDAVTLAGDNTPRRVSIAAARLPAQLQYQSVPRNAETAFISAYINNATD